jgi:glucose-1-phosphate thymidylyltransferase
LKAVILAGGKGTRLLPLTRATGKQLLPVFDKPVIYYPLSTLIHAGATEILIISSPKDIGMIKHLLGNGKKLGISLSYLIQEIPMGLADGVKISKNFWKKILSGSFLETTCSMGLISVLYLRIDMRKVMGQKYLLIE